MKKIIRLTESDLARIVRCVIKEQGELDMENNFNSENIKSDPNFKKLVMLLKKNPEIVMDLKNDLEEEKNELYENEEDSEEEFWNKKLKAFGIGFAFPVILGLSYKFGMSIVDIIQTLVSTAFLTGIFSKKFIDSVRPKNKNKD